MSPQELERAKALAYYGVLVRQAGQQERALTAEEVEARVCAYYGYSQEAHLLMPQMVT
jgi:hypothetical protein